ncbi:PQQ-binding-like beta-propeller repeat protein [Myxococcus fulvus]|nr:PQQ-binding-like beta-propeller repeat protein [Myxococcus fulvus]
MNMGRWRASTAGLMLGMWTLLGCGGSDAPIEPPPREEEPPPQPPEPPKLEPGDARWTVHSRLPGQQEVVVLASDGLGGLVLLGTSRTTGTSGPTSVEANGTSLVLSHHDGTGQVRWTRTFTPEPSSEGGPAIAHAQLLGIASTAELFIAGRVEGRLRLGETLIADSYFVAKLAADGTAQWARSTGTLKALTPDIEGEVVVAHGRLVTRYDARGTVRWSQELPAMSSASAVALDPDGGAVLVGQRPLAPFESIGFIARLSPVGEVYWELEVGPDAPNFTHVAFAADGGLRFTGDFAGTLHWGGSVLSPTCDAQGCPRAAFILAADAAGRPLWGHALTGTASGEASGARLASDVNGGTAVLFRHGCGSELVRLGARGALSWRAPYVTEPCAPGLQLRDITFLPGGDLASAGTFSGTRAFGAQEPFTADDTDTFLQRLVP